LDSQVVCGWNETEVGKEEYNVESWELAKTPQVSYYEPTNNSYRNNNNIPQIFRNQCDRTIDKIELHMNMNP